MSTTTKVTLEESITHIKKLTELARLVLGFITQELEVAEAKRKSVKEALTYATNHNMPKTDIVLSFIKAGFNSVQANSYANQVGRVQRNANSKGKLAKGQVSFDQAVKIARRDKKEANPDRLDIALYEAIKEVLRLADKAELSKEDLHKRIDLIHAEGELAHKQA